MAQQYKDRIKLLEDHEIDELYGLPRFDPDEQAYYFSMTQLEYVNEAFGRIVERIKKLAG